MGLSVNSRTRDQDHDSSDKCSLQDTPNDVFFAPYKISSYSVAVSKHKSGQIGTEDQIDLHQLIASDNLVSDDDFLFSDKVIILQRTGIDKNIISTKRHQMTRSHQNLRN